MLILNTDDIKRSVSLEDVLIAVEKALILQEEGDFLMPDRMHIELNNNMYLLMPAVASNLIVTKLVSVFPGNIKREEPSIYGSVILNDGSTGKPMALIEGSTITALRTGAVGGVGIDMTSPKEIKNLGLIGAGIQGFHQVLFACEVRHIEKVFIYDPDHKNIAGFISKLNKQLPNVNFVIAESTEHLIDNSECIITATTSNNSVLPGNASLLEGKHYIGIGSFKPNMREFPDELFSLLDQVIIDTDLAKKETGDLVVPLRRKFIKDAQIIRLGQLLNKKKSIDTAKTTFFKSVGMALFDLMTAKTIYEKAIEKNIGTKIKF